MTERIILGGMIFFNINKNLLPKTVALKIYDIKKSSNITHTKNTFLITIGVNKTKIKE